MGHASAQITLDVYGHLMDDAHKDAAEKSEEFVFKKLNELKGNGAKKEVASDSQPLDLIGSGVRI